MTEKSYKEQMRIIRDPDDQESTRVPSMPLLLVFDNGMVAEARTIRGAAAAIIGSAYLDVEDGMTEWHLRVEVARKEAMKALSRDVNVVVFDSRHGVIANNYAAAPGDPDYENDEGPIQMPVKIRVENDRLFILSLLELGLIKVYERVDSYLLRPHQKWEVEAQSGGSMQSCTRCLHKEESGEHLLCHVYNSIKEKTDGSRCGSFTPEKIESSSNDEYTGGEYIDLELEYGGVQKLIAQVGQEWIIDKE